MRFYDGQAMKPTRFDFPDEIPIKLQMMIASP
jgi:hypothetical protein